MVTPDRKVRKLMKEYQKTGSVLKAALRADLDPKTGRKYLKAGKLPSQMAVDGNSLGPSHRSYSANPGVPL